MLSGLAAAAPNHKTSSGQDNNALSAESAVTVSIGGDILRDYNGEPDREREFLFLSKAAAKKLGDNDFTRQVADQLSCYAPHNSLSEVGETHCKECFYELLKKNKYQTKITFSARSDGSSRKYWYGGRWHVIDHRPQPHPRPHPRR
jgi:hypothetical protein